MVPCPSICAKEKPQTPDYTFGSKGNELKTTDFVIRLLTYQDLW